MEWEKIPWPATMEEPTREVGVVMGTVPDALESKLELFSLRFGGTSGGVCMRLWAGEIVSRQRGPFQEWIRMELMESGARI